MTTVASSTSTVDLTSELTDTPARPHAIVKNKFIVGRMDFDEKARRLRNTNGAAATSAAGTPQLNALKQRRSS